MARVDLCPDELGRGVTLSGFEDEDFEISSQIEVAIQSVAASVAECSRVVLRETETTRLSFEATLIGNGTVGTGVRGHLIYEKRSIGQPWADVNRVKLSSLRAGESISVELKTAEVLELRQWLADLQALKDTYGLPADAFFVGIRRNMFYKIARKPEFEVIVPKAGPAHLVPALRAVLAQDDFSAVAAALGDTPIQELLALRRQVGLSALDHLIAEWDRDPMNAEEEHWQKLLSSHSFALEQVFYVPTVVVGEKAYVGGKHANNRGGSLADFLCRNALSGRSLLVEIKSPSASLLAAKQYRNSVWNASNDLGGAILQVLTYRDTLHEQMSSVDEDGVFLRRSAPGCAVIIGHSQELDHADKVRSFELTRRRGDVIVLTFDELRLRLGAIRDALLAV